MRQESFSGRVPRRFAMLCACSALLAACGAEGLAVGNLVRKDGGASFKIANDSRNTGDVVLWIEQDGIVSCERVLRVEANHTYDVTIACPGLSVRPFKLRALWASMARDRALVAQRIE